MIDEFLTVSLYQPNEFISRKLNFIFVTTRLAVTIHEYNAYLGSLTMTDITRDRSLIFVQCPSPVTSTVLFVCELLRLLDLDLGAASKSQSCAFSPKLCMTFRIQATTHDATEEP